MRTHTKPTKESAPHSPLHAVQVADALLSLKTAGKVLEVDAKTVRRRANSDPTFPRLLKLSKGCTRIRAGDLTRWIGEQVAKAA